MSIINDLHIDATAIVGLVALGVVAGVAIAHGDGEVVAGAAVGAIGGFMARGGVQGRTVTTTEGDPPVTTTTE